MRVSLTLFNVFLIRISNVIAKIQETCTKITLLPRKLSSTDGRELHRLFEDLMLNASTT